MPTGKETDTAGAANNTGKRTTFRPPWVKESPNPLPVPTAPWTLKNANRRESNSSDTQDNPLAGIQLRKTSIQTKEPQENGVKESIFVKPNLKPVPPKEAVSNRKDHKINIPKLNSVAERQLKDPRPSISRSSSGEEELERVLPVARHALVRADSLKRPSETPAPPPMPGMPPPPPPPPSQPTNLNKKTLNDSQMAKIEQLKSRPKNRPDWTAMLKEIEGNKKLRHVVCNDRSQPLLPEAKAKEHFLYESEKPNVHNELLKQIQGGIKLKTVKTNDRSKPMLEGLRKFRRQMTIEEQIQKSISMASIAPEEIADEADEMDDIDKVRDDLQSTKQMLALELRNKEAQERENKRLLVRILNLEAELEKERSTSKTSDSGSKNSSDADEKIVKSLKLEAENARKTSEELEKKYRQVTEDLDNTKGNLEEIKKQHQILEKRLQDALQGKRISLSEHKDSIANGDNESDEEVEEEESSEESDEENKEEKKEKRSQRELKQLINKLRNFKNKEDNAKKERLALREIIKKHQAAIKEEMKKYKQLQKEVDKMAALMKESSDDEDEGEEKETLDEEESSEEESSDDESESDSNESDTDKSQSEDEDAPTDKKKENITCRVNRHENILGALKKGNFLLKTNAERLQDDLNKQKELTAALQEDLDSVLSELG